MIALFVKLTYYLKDSLYSIEFILIFCRIFVWFLTNSSVSLR
jgi:hypothetical protein